MSRSAVVAPTFLLPLSGGGKSLRHTRRIVRHDVRAACSSHPLKRGGMGWGSHELQISDDTGGARHAPGRTSRLMLALVPFVLLALVYVMGSAERRAVNPDDKLLPPVSELASAFHRVAFEPDRRSEEIVLWTDTAASLHRLGLGLGIA